MVDYSKYIELDDVTLEDCLELFIKENMVVILNDGQVINFVNKTT